MVDSAVSDEAAADDSSGRNSWRRSAASAIFRCPVTPGVAGIPEATRRHLSRFSLDCFSSVFVFDSLARKIHVHKLGRTGRLVGVLSPWSHTHTYSHQTRKRAWIKLPVCVFQSWSGGSATVDTLLDEL